jgi:hypothetical protein
MFGCTTSNATLAGHLVWGRVLWTSRSQIFITSQSLRDFACDIFFLNQRLTLNFVRDAWLWRPAIEAWMSAKWGGGVRHLGSMSGKWGLIDPQRAVLQAGRPCPASVALALAIGQWTF